MILFSLKKKFNVFIGDSSTYRFLLDKKLLQPGIVLTKVLLMENLNQDFMTLLKHKVYTNHFDHEHGILDDFDYKKFFIKSRIEKRELEKFDAFFAGALTIIKT